MEFNSLDFKKLLAFHLVGQHGNLRLAASRLHQTVPAISAKLRRLEEDLGVKLFERLPNRLILTSAGENFLKEVEAVFERSRQALATLSAPDRPQSRVAVSIGGDLSWFFAPRIGTYLKRNPAIELSLYLSKGPDAMLAVGRGEFDLSISCFNRVPKTLEREVILETTLSLVCAPDHPLARQTAPSLAEIARHRLITLPRYAETRKLIDRKMAEALVEPKSIIEVANCAAARTLTAMGVGVGIVHTLCMGHEPSEQLCVTDLGTQFGTLAFSAVYRKASNHRLLLRGLLEALEAE